MLFKKYFLRKAIKNKVAKLKNISSINFIFENLSSKDELSNEEFCNYKLNTKYQNIFSNSININKILTDLVKKGKLNKLSDKYRQNYRTINAIVMDNHEYRKNIFEIYSKIDNLKIFPKIITRFLFEKLNYSVIIFSNLNNYHLKINVSFKFRYIAFINFLNDAKKLYEVGLSLKYLSMSNLENYINGWSNNAYILESITLKSEDETFENFAKQFIIKCFNSGFLGDYYKKIEECEMPYEHSDVITKEMFDVLKQNNVLNIDYIQLLINVFKCINFDNYWQSHKIFNKEYIVSPKVFKIKTHKKCKNFENLKENELDILHKVACYIMQFEYDESKLLYNSLLNREYNLNMQFVGIKTKYVENTSKVKFLKMCDIENVNQIYNCIINTVKKLSSLVTNYPISFKRNIDIEKDLYKINSQDEYLLKDISLFTIKKDEINDYKIILMFILDCLRKMSDYVVEDGVIKYKSISCVNYLSLERLKFVEQYFLNPYFLDKSDINFSKEIVAFTYPVLQIYEYPKISTDSMSVFAHDKIYLKNNIQYIDEFHEILNDKVKSFYTLSKNKSIKVLVYDSYTKYDLKGYVMTIPVNYTSIFSEEFFKKYNEKDVIKILINLAYFLPMDHRYPKEITTSFFDEIKDDLILDENLTLYCTNVYKISLGINESQFSKLVQVVLQTCRQYQTSGNPGSIFNLSNIINLSYQNMIICLKNMYSKLTIKHSTLNIWYDGDYQGLFKFLYPKDYIVDISKLGKILYIHKYNTIYKYGTDNFINIFDENVVNMESLINVKLNKNELIARDSQNFKIIGFIGKLENLLCYNSEKEEIIYNYVIDLKREKESWNVFKYLTYIIDFLNQEIKKLNYVFFANLEFEDWDFCKFLVLIDDKICTIKHLDVLLKNNPNYSIYKDESNIYTLVNKRLSHIINDIINNEYHKKNFEYYFTKEQFNYLNDFSDLNFINSLFYKVYKKCKDSYCDIHKIYYNCEIYEDCPKCIPDSINYLTIDLSSFNDNMKKGGEALIYEASEDSLYKIYRKNSNGNYIVDVSKKIKIINSWLEVKSKVETEIKGKEFSIILPNKLLKDKSDKKFCGISMNKVKNAKSISVLMDIEYAQKIQWTYRDVLKILINLGKALEYLEKNNWYIGDFNGGNILFDNSYHVFIIDTDSLGGIASNEPIAFVESFLDPKAYIKGDVKTNISTDYYSYAIIAFSTLTGLHPFGGIYRENGKIVPQIVRMKKGISVLGNHNIKIPDTIFKWEWMSQHLKNKFLSIFEGNNRENILPYLERELTLDINKAKKIDEGKIDIDIKNVAKNENTKIELIFDSNHVLNLYQIINSKIALMTNTNTFYDILNSYQVTLNEISSEEFIKDIWFVSDKEYYFVLTQKKLYYVKSKNNVIIKFISIHNFENVKHSKSGNEVFLLDQNNKLKMIKYRKKVKELKFTNKATINGCLENKGTIVNFYISKDASIIVFYLSKVNYVMDQMMFFDVEKNKCITSLNIPNSYFDFNSINNKNAYFDSLNHDNILITFDQNQAIYFKFGEQIGNFELSEEIIKLDVEYVLNENVTVYNGILFYPLDGYIGAINLNTYNKKIFHCDVCNKNCKIERIVNGFDIIDNKNLKIYKFFI